MINYDGRRFRQPDGDGTVAVFHQRGEVVWGEFAGGEVVRGFTAGTCEPDGTLRMGYTMVLAGGEVICGHTVNSPEMAGDGHFRLKEGGERYGPHAATGTSYVEELRVLTVGATKEFEEMIQ